MKLVPRHYQLAAIDKALASEHRRILIVSPGASGKTLIEALLARHFRRRGKRVLWVLPRRETLHQAVAHAQAVGLRNFGVMIYGTEPTPTARLQIATSSTVLVREPFKADVVLWDEAHHMVAEGAMALSKHYSRALHYGLTATPIRLDGKGLDEFYDEMLIAAQPSELIGERLISVPRIFCPDVPDLSSIRVRDNDYEPQALGEMMGTDGLVGNVLEHWQKHARGRRTVGFAVTREHSMRLCARFAAAGVRAAHIDGSTSPAVRDRTLRAFERGQIQVLWNCMVLSEGWDVPSCRVAILARPTMSLQLTLQQCNRVARVFEYDRPLILDHAGNVLRHGLPYADRNYTLSGTASDVAGAAPSRRCPECHAANHLAAKVCVECGHEFWNIEDKLAESADLLMELTKQRLLERREKIVAFAKTKGFPDDWTEAVLSRWSAIEAHG